MLPGTWAETEVHCSHSRHHMLSCFCGPWCSDPERLPAWVCILTSTVVRVMRAQKGTYSMHLSCLTKPQSVYLQHLTSALFCLHEAKAFMEQLSMAAQYKGEHPPGRLAGWQLKHWAWLSRGEQAAPWQLLEQLQLLQHSKPGHAWRLLHHRLAQLLPHQLLWMLPLLQVW